MTTTDKKTLTPPNSHLLRALYQWLLENEHTPLITVDITELNISIPEESIPDNELVINISPNATRNLIIGEDFLECDVQFSGLTNHFCVPIFSIISIHSQEINIGMNFSPEEYKKFRPDAPAIPPKMAIVSQNDAPKSNSKKATKKPKLKIVSRKDATIKKK